MGIIFDGKLRFRGQVSKVLQKAYINLRNIFKSQNVLNFKLKKILCEAWIWIIVILCMDHAWIFETNINLKKNSCIRFIYNLKQSDDVSHKLCNLKWLSISGREKLRFACFLHKLIITKTHLYLFEKITPRNIIHSRGTRFNVQYQIPRVNKAMTRSSFSYSSVKLLNQYPCIIQLKNVSFCTF